MSFESKRCQSEFFREKLEAEVSHRREYQFTYFSTHFFCSLPLSPLLVYRVPCGRLIPFRWCGGAPGYFPRSPTPTLSTRFSFLDDTIRSQHNIHGWPIRPGFEPCRPRGGGRKSVSFPSTTLPSAPERHTHTSMARRRFLPWKKSSPFGEIRTH
jgi:hypothetical protein